MLTVVLLLAVGVVAGRLRALPDGTARALDAFVITVALPALVLALVPSLRLRPDVLLPAALAWTSLLLSAAAVLGLSRLLRWDRRTTGTLLVVVPLGNTSFLGIPAVEALLGADHLPYALVYDQLGSFLALATYAAVVAGHYGSATVPTVRDTARRVATFPPLVALGVAGILLVTGMPAWLAAVADRLGATVTPLAMVAVGMRLRLPDRGASPRPLLAGLAVRLLAVPAVLYGVVRLLGSDGPAGDASVLAAAMPPMVTASVVAADAGLDADLAARLAGVGVLVAMATLPAWTLLLT